MLPVVWKRYLVETGGNVESQVSLQISCSGNDAAWF